MAMSFLARMRKAFGPALSFLRTATSAGPAKKNPRAQVLRTNLSRFFARRLGVPIIAAAISIKLRTTQGKEKETGLIVSQTLAHSNVPNQDAIIGTSIGRIP